ncbi:MAG: Gfo/Idh/MocA family oxidoreductase [Kribbellaceae bacterium]|nr:Gfo/Idh/MocA family oxidoreductase [Kribbellaceae bacterium]
MALDEQQDKEVEYAAASADATCMVGYSFRYGMAKYVSRLLAQGAVGEPRVITGAIGTPSMNGGWVARTSSGGGPMLYVGCHLIDLALWFMDGEPTEVTGQVNRRDDSGVDETSAATLRFADRRLAQFVVTQRASGFFYDLRIVGSGGFIGLRGRNFVQFEIDVQSEVLDAYREPTAIRPAAQGDHITSMLLPELTEFATAVAEQRPAAVTATDGRRVLRVMDAIGQSSQTQQPVTLKPMLSAY